MISGKKKYWNNVDSSLKKTKRQILLKHYKYVVIRSPIIIYNIHDHLLPRCIKKNKPNAK